jgi:hypothetical protein
MSAMAKSKATKHDPDEYDLEPIRIEEMRRFIETGGASEGIPLSPFVSDADLVKRLARKDDAIKGKRGAQ